MDTLFLIVGCCELLLACMTYRAGLPKFAVAIAVTALVAQALHQLGTTGLAFVCLFASTGLILWSMKVIKRYDLID